MGIKYNVNENYFDSWSHEMAYVLGFWYADGSLENSLYIRGQYIRVSSTDSSIIQAIKRSLESEHKIVIAKQDPPRKSSFLLRIGSHYLYKAMTKHGLYPKKSLTMTMPNIPRKYLASFTRGYFDGDGCVYLEKSNGKTCDCIVKRLNVIFTCGSELFIEQLSNMLHSAYNVSCSTVCFNQRAYRVRYSTRDSIRLFNVMYASPCDIYLHRKFNTFREYFALRPKVVNPLIAHILQEL